MSHSPNSQNHGRRGTVIILPLPGIGDLIWHLSHIHRIARATPEGTVTILTKRRSHADRLLAADPSVLKVLWVDRGPGIHDGILGFFRLVNMLSKHRFAQAWVLHQSARYALAAFMAGIPQRIGYGRGLQRWLLNQPLQLPRTTLSGHPIDMADSLLTLHRLPKRDGDTHLPLTPAATAEVARKFGGLPKPWIAIGVGSSEQYKQWGEQRFSELVLALRKPERRTLFVVGGPAEEHMARSIASQAGGADVVTVTDLSIDLTAALIADCAIYIGNDTGALNLAAALAVPAIGLFGGSRPLHHSPHIRGVQPESANGGMGAIDVPMVLSAVRDLGVLEQ